MLNDLAYWVALSTNSKIGARSFQKILACYDDMEEAWKASHLELKKKGLPDILICQIIKTRGQLDPQRELKKVVNLGISVVTIKGKGYPDRLKEIPDPPAILYFRGQLLAEDVLAIAIVGARKYSSYGIRVTEEIVSRLAQAGLTIVSGLALGIDGAAHKAALENSSGRTIAVLANGLDSVYPYSHKNLAEKIIKGRGALISEFPLGTPALKYNFPIRNRIIAGLSLGVVVIEANLQSGSLLTAKAALDYNREVFAVPGDIYRETALGPNNLIKMGAKSVTSSEDILEELNIEVKSSQREVREILPDSTEEGLILTCLSRDEAIYVDKLVTMTKLDIATLNSKLILMEMKGKVKNLGGSQYVLGR